MSRLALCDVVGPLNDLNQKLAGENGDEWLLDLKKFLRKENPWEIPNIDPEAFYDILGMSKQFREAQNRFDLSGQPGIWKLPMLKGLTYDKLVRAYHHADIKLETFGVNLQKAIDPKKEQRDPNRDGDYLVNFKRNIEADEENKNQSANQREEQECQDGTLAERLLLGGYLYLPARIHLDIKVCTLCAGSRYRDGNVPYVRWDAGGRRVSVRWYDSDYRHDYLRSRSVVSLPATQATPA